MTPEKFQQLASDGYNRIPVTREVLADLDTPLSTYLKLASGPYSFLSVRIGAGWREVGPLFDYRVTVQYRGANPWGVYPGSHGR